MEMFVILPNNHKALLDKFVFNFSFKSILTCALPLAVIKFYRQDR